MGKQEIISQVLKAATARTSRRRFANIHVRHTLDEFFNVAGQSMSEQGKFSYPGFGRFVMNKKTGQIKFHPSAAFEKKVSGTVESTLDDDFDDYDNDEDDNEEYKGRDDDDRL